LILVLASALVQGASGEPSWKWRFTFVAPFRSDYWTKIAQGIQDASRETDANTIVTGPVGEVNADLQIQAIEAAIASKVDGIVTMALDPDRFTKVIDKAEAAGIPVVLVDTDAPGSRRDAYIGTDNYAAGQEAARLMMQAIGRDAEIGIITGPAEADNQKLRISGFRKVLSAYPGLRIVDTQIGNSEFLLVRERLQAMLSAHPGISALFGADGYGALAGAAIVRQLDRVGKIAIIGFDASDDVVENIRNGIIDAVIVQDNYQMGYQAVRVLAGIKSGKKPPFTVIKTATRVLNRQNIASYVPTDSPSSSP
jgi:ribose transport system substrate-binding protein